MATAPVSAAWRPESGAPRVVKEDRGLSGDWPEPDSGVRAGGVGHPAPHKASQRETVEVKQVRNLLFGRNTESVGREVLSPLFEALGLPLQGHGRGLGQEPLCRQFRQLRYEDTAGPREALRRLRELCRQWLRPETHSKEQILELLVLEQFLAILPAELRARVQEKHPESGEALVAALEDVQLDLGAGGQQEVKEPDQEKKNLLRVEVPGLRRAVQAQQLVPACEGQKPKKEEDEEVQIENGKLVTTGPSGAEGSPLKAHRGGSSSESRRREPQPPAATEHARAHTGGSVRDSAACQSSAPPGHQEPHAREKGHQCHECGKVFQRSSHLVRHRKIHLGEKPYQCKECGKVFSQNAGLLEHLRIHTGEKPFLCIHCGKNFRRSSHLNRHHRIHSQEEPCECKECGKTFSQALLLTHHQRIHSHSRSHRCNECGKAFSLTSDLIRHHRIHTGEKPFTCGVCQKAFRLNSHLDQHTRIHNEEKPYRCAECGDAFRQKSGLFQHQRHHHRGGLA